MESFQDFLLTEVADYEAYLKKYANSKSKKKLMTRTDFNTWKKHNEYWKSLPKKNGIVTGPAKKKVAEEVEQIDELEKKTVHSYLNKADPSQGMRNAEKETPGILKNPNALRQYKKKVKAGVSRALDRLKPKQSVSEAAQIGVGSKVYHPIHGSGKVLKHSTGAGADHWAEVKFLSGNTKRVNRKHLKLEEVVAEGEEQSHKVTYDIYGSNKEKPLYTNTRTVRASSEKEAINTLRKLVGGANHRVEKQHVAEGSERKDMTGQTCEKCKKDKYEERSQHDDMEGKVTCSCGHRVNRWKNYKEQVVEEGAVDHSALGKHHEEMTDQELRKVGSKLPNSWDAAAFRRKLASHPKYAQALKHYDKSEYHFGKAARQANKKVTEGMDYSVTVKHTKDGKTTDHEYTVKNANDKRHAKNIALQRHEKKIGGLKDSEQISASSNHVKELRKEEVHIHEALDPSEIAGNPKMYDAATVKKAFYHKNASESDKQSLARHLDRHHGNKEWRKSVKEEAELCPKCGMNPCQCDGFAEQKETNMSISFKDFVNMLEEAKCKMKEAEEIETSDYKTDKNGRKHRAHKIVFNKGENKQEKDDDEDDMKEELKGNQHKLDKNKNGKLDAHDFKLLRKEEVEQLEEDFVEILEAYDPEDYKAGHEKSQFKDGYRATLTHKKTGKVSYVGGTAYKSKEHAEGEAEVYRKHYSVGSGKATPGANYRHDRAVSDYRKKAKEAGHIAEAKFDALKLDEAETIKKDGVTRHKGDYGTSYDGDDNKKPAPTVKRGRGRPKKGSDETGEVKKFDFSALIQKHKIPKFTGKSTVHKMKD